MPAEVLLDLSPKYRDIPIKVIKAGEEPFSVTNFNSEKKQPITIVCGEKDDKTVISYSLNLANKPQLPLPGTIINRGQTTEIDFISLFGKGKLKIRHF